MLYKLTVVALFLCVNVNHISGQEGDATDLTKKAIAIDLTTNNIALDNTETEDADQDADAVDLLGNQEDTNDTEDDTDNTTDEDTNDTDPEDTNDTDIETDDTDLDNDGTDIETDDTDVDNDGTDIDDTDDTEDDADDTDDTDDNDTDLNASFEATLADSVDNTDSIADSVDSTSSQDESSDKIQSGEGSQEESGDESQSGDGSNDADSEEDECGGLSQTACGDIESSDGDKECGYNKETGECYGIERRAGTHGSGNFDDGYTAAKQAAAEESTQLYTVVGVLGGVIGALVLLMAGCGYYLYNKKTGYQMREFDLEEATRSGHTMSVIDDGQELIQVHTVEDVSPVITK